MSGSVGETQGSSDAQKRWNEGVECRWLAWADRFRVLTLMMNICPIVSGYIVSSPSESTIHDVRLQRQLSLREGFSRSLQWF